MTIHQISVFLENKPGRLAQVCRILSDGGINILNMTLADTKEFGIARFIVKEWERATQVLQNSGLTVQVVDVLVIEVENAPGGLASLLTFLEGERLNIDYIYAFPQSFTHTGKSLIVIKFRETEQAVQVMKNHLPKVLTAEEFYSADPENQENPSESIDIR